jgi:hypothetical protein
MKDTKTLPTNKILITAMSDGTVEILQSSYAERYTLEEIEQIISALLDSFMIPQSRRGGLHVSQPPKAFMALPPAVTLSVRKKGSYV